MDEPDPAVLAAARRGDRPAVGELLALAQPAVWRYIGTLERNRETVEDLTQETLLRVVRSVGRFRAQSRFRTWVFSIAHNVVRDHQRSVARRPRLVADLVGDNRAAPEIDPSVALDLDAALAAVPDGLRDVFVLVEVMGLRYREVAEILGIAEGTVKSRMFHVRSELARLLAVREEVDDGT